MLQEFQVRVSRKQVERLMKEQGLEARRKKSGMNTTDSRHLQPVEENLLNREFRACGPGEKWVSDITYLRTSSGWLYLTVILDLWSLPHQVVQKDKGVLPGKERKRWERTACLREGM
jgi:transposase InsO family protein